MIEAINGASKVLLLPHKNADGDCLGSSFALKLALLQMGKAAFVMTEEEEPLRLMSEIYCGANAPLDGYDLVIAVDSADMSRLGMRARFFRGNTINIDHHITNTNYAKINCVHPGAAAVGEIIYELIRDLGVEIDVQIATNLYAAIASDCGGFMYANTTVRTFAIAGELVRLGAEHIRINKYLFGTNSMAKIDLMKECLFNLKVHHGGKIAIVTISKEVLERTGATLEECDGIVSIPRSVEGVEVAMLIKETEAGCKVSMRSEGELDVSVFCKRFGGGGHKRAAGCELNMSIGEASQLMIKEVGNEL